MKIAFVGKGGSGKSTVSWLFTQYLLERGLNVLAIDSDYNMDLSNALGWHEGSDSHYLNQSEKDFYRYQGLAGTDLYFDLPIKESLKAFSFLPTDEFTDKYAFGFNNIPNLRLMIAGMSNEEILFSRRCTHAYLAPLKYYLPKLELSDNSAVIVDGVAGTDMVTYGLYTGVDLLVVIIEPTPNSINVFKQIKNIAEQFDIPTKAVINKLTVGFKNQYVEDFLKEYSDYILGIIPRDEGVIFYDYSEVQDSTKKVLENIWLKLKDHKSSNEKQWQRFIAWREKFEELEKVLEKTEGGV